MQNFIVLGLIPGTDLQFNFETWLMICAGLAALFILFRLRHSIRALVLGWYVAYLIKHHELTPSLR